ncbi:MAG: peptide deformylase [Deltaproteobacteria bacterium]|nr:peptide deformylase [Deltaproteobacteria bacterium]
MPLLNILTFPDSMLREKCDPVEEIDNDLIQLLDDMADTMYEAPGVGLAAPQVGYTKRVIVVDIKPRECAQESTEEEEILLPPDRSELIELINPEIVFSDGEVTGEEGCLSIPGFVSDVKRKFEVTVEGYNRDGELLEIKCEDLLARVFQHEIDHLDGILFIDRLGRLKRELLKKKIEKVLGKEEKYAVL